MPELNAVLHSDAKVRNKKGVVLYQLRFLVYLLDLLLTFPTLIYTQSSPAACITFMPEDIGSYMCLRHNSKQNSNAFRTEGQQTLSSSHRFLHSLILKAKGIGTIIKGKTPLLLWSSSDRAKMEC